MITPQPIIQLDPETNGFKLDEAQYEKLFTSEETKYLPVAIISIVGDYRKGKSFLLNFFLRYLKECGHAEWNDLEDKPLPDWMGDINEPLKGFSWRPGVAQDTIGIILWPEPLIITRKDGKKIAVLLMDTQGLFDDRTDHQDVGRFYAISSMVSSLQIYNQMNNIQSNDITTLSAFSEYGKKVFGRTGHKAFQNLLILLRDWRNTKDFSFGLEGGRNFLDYKRKSLSEQFNSEWKQIEDCYSNLDCFLMPSIGDDAIEDDKFDGSVNRIKPAFLAHLNSLVSLILSPENIPIKTVDGREQTLWEVGNHIQNLAARLKDNDKPGVSCLLSINDETRVANAFSGAIKLYVDRVDILMNQENVKIDRASLNQIEKEVIIFYWVETQYVNQELKIEKFNDLYDSISNLRTNIETQTSNKWFKKIRDDVSKNIGKIAGSIGISGILYLSRIFILRRF